MARKKFDENKIVKRAFEFKDIRAIEPTDGGNAILEGHAAVFNSKTSIGDWFNEIIDRGAFDGCDFTDVPLFVNHETDKVPLARSRRNNGNSTMTLSIDDVGLSIRAELDIENNQDAKQVYSAIQRGDITGMSFSFSVGDDDDSWDDLDSDMPTRSIHRIAKVYEVSAVNWPAYDDTDINARDKKALDNAKLALKNARSKDSDESNAIEIYKIKNRILGGM